MGGKLLVLLGRRASIPCILRKYMIPDTHAARDGRYAPNERPELPDLDEIVDRFSHLATAQCFLIVSNGYNTTIIEKDWKNAVTRSDPSFVVCTNHDEAEEHPGSAPAALSEEDSSIQHAIEEERKEHIPDSAAVTGMNEILEESVGRKQHIEKNWKRARDKHVKENAAAEEADFTVSFASVKRWLTHERITSPCTHFSVIMDPKKGEIAWAERYPTPDWVIEHVSDGDGDGESMESLQVSR